VRISAGFPYFFPPLKLRDAATKKEGVLVDGGVVSAYPIFLFDSAEPKHPTWGFRLFSGKPPEKPPHQGRRRVFLVGRHGRGDPRRLDERLRPLRRKALRPADDRDPDR
jgi:predicted acylesterase/phospholipase RssA